MESKNTVFLDTETTGLNGGRGDEVIEIAIIDGNGDVLLNTLVKPVTLSEWPDAQQINGISPDDVNDSPSLELLMPQIIDIIKDKIVIIYNSGFDVSFFPASTFNNSNVECCMLRFSERIGEWNDRRGGYRWHKLVAAADHVGYVWSGDPHRALADTLATRSVWQWLDATEAGVIAKQAQAKADKAKRKIANKKAREAYAVKIKRKEQVFARSLRRRGATPDVFIPADSPEREAVLTKHAIFKANREGEKWVVAGFGYTPSGRTTRETFLLYQPFHK